MGETCGCKSQNPRGTGGIALTEVGRGPREPLAKRIVGVAELATSILDLPDNATMLRPRHP
eukprot:6782654-Lingulodinium_polyedra.AAC.1